MGGAGETEVGVCLVDASIGTFTVGQFDDDRFRSRLSTLLTHYGPVEALTERRHLSAETRHLLQTSCPEALHDQLRAGDEFWDAPRTLRFLAEGGYFAKVGHAPLAPPTRPGYPPMGVVVDPRFTIVRWV